jgi:hypothetical protein
MPRYEFLEPLKPIVYCRFVQRWNKRVSPNFKIKNFLNKQFYINIFAVIYGSLHFSISAVEYSDILGCYALSCGLQPFKETCLTVEDGGTTFVPKVGEKFPNVSSIPP